jgi:flagellar hook-length control protein FliK
MQQMADKIDTLRVTAAAGGQQKAQIQLHPKEWGQLNLSVTMTPIIAADGTKTNQISAQVVAQSSSVKAALDQHLPELKRSMEASGLKVESLSVTVQAINTAAQSGSTAGGGNFSEHHGGQNWDQSGSQSAPTSSGGGSFDGGNQSSFAAFSGGDFGGRQGSQHSPYSPAAALESSEAALVSSVAKQAARAGGVDLRA